MAEFAGIELEPIESWIMVAKIPRREWLLPVGAGKVK